MPLDLLITQTAADEVREHYHRMARTSSRRAEEWQRALLAAVASLAHSPERCPFALEDAWYKQGLRELLVGKRRNVYRILFRVERNTVVIMRVRHALQDHLRPGEL